MILDNRTPESDKIANISFLAVKDTMKTWRILSFFIALLLQPSETTIEVNIIVIVFYRGKESSTFIKKKIYVYMLVYGKKQNKNRKKIFYA